MNIGPIIAVVVAILASAVRSKKLAQEGNEEAWPTNPYPPTVDAETEQKSTVPHTHTPQHRSGKFPHSGKRFNRAETHLMRASAGQLLQDHHERLRERIITGEVAHPTPHRNTQQQPIKHEEEQQHELVRNFDPQRAIIYAEIMKPKFEEYE